MKAKLTRDSARALVDAGYMPLAHYIEMFGEDAPPETISPSIVPKKRRSAPVKKLPAEAVQVKLDRHSRRRP
ncbi:hypothetical protein RAD15_34580 [Bradyrhizobium sp. 14AA]|uniref:hypothetical protein n=1 Tax=Bradyrhizobium sp. 149 TaxID=2782624 RepID=UPI001FF9EBF8|nr:hypothetical protein [Bradyrhizobium sp. 149]MCK1653200.1 hypothetical protein [Bradyrhizobium sp. 149]